MADNKKLVFRKLEMREHILTRPLYEECFYEDEPCFVDYYYANRADRNEIWAAIEPESGHIVSMLHANPVTLICRDRAGEKHGRETASEVKRVTVPYLVAIGTAKRYRRQGLMRQLMEMALRQFRTDRVPFVFLMPASESYYRPFHFQRSWSWQWEETACPAPDGQSDLRYVNAEELTDEQLEQMAAYVNAALEGRYDMFVQRSAAYYRDLQLQQRASGGSLLCAALEDTAPFMAVCTAKEEFPPMMALITDRERFEALTGKICTDTMDMHTLFSNVMISEVV